MLRNQILMAIAALGLTLVLTPEAPAQRRGGGGGRGGAVHVAARPAAVGRSVAPARASAIRPAARVLAPVRVQPFRPALGNQGAFQNRRGLGGYGYGNGNGYWGGGFFNPFLGNWGWPGYYPYSNGYYDAYYPPFIYGGASMPPAVNYGGADIGDAVPIPTAAAAPAQIDVILPDPDATLWFNGYQTTSHGTNREFTTPELQPGGDYSYTVRAAWTQNGTAMSREYAVRVGPGARLLVDFTLPPVDVPIAK